MKAKFSIRYKFLAVTTALLIFCVGVYLFIAIQEFKNDKKSLVFDYNKSLVVNTSSDIESFFTGMGDKMRLMALFYRESASKRRQMVSDLMREGQDLVFVAGSERFSELNQTFYEDQQFLKTYGLDPKTWQEELLKLRPIPFHKIQTEGEALWNATIPDGAPLIGFGKSVVEEDARGVPLRQFAVVGYVKADRLIRALSEGRPNEVYVMTSDGEILAHVNPRVMGRVPKTFREGGASLEEDHLYKIAKSDFAQSHSMKKKVVEYKTDEGRYLGAYAFTFNDRVLVLSKISEKKAFLAVHRLVFRSLIFASMVVTLAFLVAIFFSRSLTRPLDTLMQGMSRVSEGDLSSHIQIQSKDEIGHLAFSFNRMIQDLKASREELENINRELEDKVRARTRDLELQNQAVKEAQEALLRTTRLAAVGEVAGQAAHEVLNPLTSIISRLNRLKDRVQMERSRELQVLLDINKEWKSDYSEGGFQKLIQNWQAPSKVNPAQSLWEEDLSNIQSIGVSVVQEFKALEEDTSFLLSEAERIGRIVSSFRTLSAPRGEHKEVSVHALCDRSIKIMADLAMKENIQLVTSWNSSVDTTNLDEDEFIQVMTNLIRNALQSVTAKKFKNGEGRINLYSNQKEESIEIHISDNGMGINEKHKNRLFEKNFTTKSKSEGTGIGLSISRRLIRAFQGDLVLLESVENKGAHFVITLPLSKSVRERGVA